MINQFTKGVICCYASELDMTDGELKHFQDMVVPSAKKLSDIVLYLESREIDCTTILLFLERVAGGVIGD